MHSLFIKLKKLFLKTILSFYRRRLQKPYCIISIGTYCLPRTITTLSKLKPRRKEGEKSMPFDLAFFNDVSAIIRLIETQFTEFYQGLEFDPEKQLWENKKLSAIFNHDGHLNDEAFKKRYDARIANFYDALRNKETRKFFVLASFAEISQEQMNSLVHTLKKHTQGDSFTIIYINQTQKKTTYTNSCVKVLDTDYKRIWFDHINKEGNWAGELKNKDAPSAINFYYKVSIDIAKAMQG